MNDDDNYEGFQQLMFIILRKNHFLIYKLVNSNEWWW